MESRESDKQIWSVSELNGIIRNLLEQSLQPFWLKGEVGNLTIHRSGHVYFSLKDQKSQVSAVFFRGAEMARKIEMKEGMEVEVMGRVTVYEPRGSYQVSVSNIRAVGVGTLQQRFEELKRKLQAEGLFDVERKRPIPVLPRCVGVVTSPEGAAIRDFLQILDRRFSGIHVRIMPVAVQGQGAAEQIAWAVKGLNYAKSCDVIVVTRGGGSLEDLWAFNEEPVARAVAESAIPVISAVGHEVDFSLCDFAADMRVPTPSAAAELVVAGKTELLERIQRSKVALLNNLRLRVANLKNRVQRAAGHAVFKEPGNVIRLNQQKIDELSMRLERSVKVNIERRKAGINLLHGRLNAMNPGRVLKRGYSILMSEEDKKVITSQDQVTPDMKLKGILADGEIELEVK